MSIIKSHTILSDLVQKHISLLPMLKRFGIRLGLGEASIEQICREHQIDLDFFLHILNSYLDPAYLGHVRLAPKHTVLIADYLEVTNRDYLQAQLPNIEVHIGSFIRHSDASNPLLQTLPPVVAELKSTIEARIQADEADLLPRFRTLAQQLGEQISNIMLEHKSDVEVQMDKAEALVIDMMQVMIRHIRGDFNDNLLHGVLYSLSFLQNDLRSNNRLRQRIFAPMMKAMAVELKEEREA